MGVDEARRSNLGYFNRDAAQSFPGRVALIDLSSTEPREITHGALDERMDQFAAALLESGLGPGDGVLVGIGNRIEYIEAFFGAMRAGIVPLPLNIKQGREVIDFIIGDSGVRGAVVEPTCNPHLVGAVEAAGLEPRIAIGDAPSGWRNYQETVTGADPASFAPAPVEPGQISFTPYTSGSTGRPKGVMLTHDGLLWAIRSTQKNFPTDAEDRYLVATPLFHKNAMRVSIKPTLFAGACAVILPEFEPRSFLDALAGYQCTYAGGVPAMYRMLLAQVDLLARLDFPKLKHLSMGSAVVGEDLLDAVEQAFKTKPIESYGLTEAGGPLRPPTDGREIPLGSCGVVAPEWEAKLIDEHGNESEEFGALWVRAPSVMKGYINQPELTAETLVDGWLDTGDIFTRDKDGFLYFHSRADDMFSVGGENVYPKEVELMLVRHPDVEDAVVCPVPHAVKDLAPAALVILRPSATATEQILKDHCLATGPSYAHPRHIFFVDAMPLNSTGKIDRNATRKIAEGLLSKAKSMAESAGS